MHDIHDILKQYWGFTQFRPLQEEIIKSVLAKNDTLALLPTGGGKSICFQVPAMAMEGICIVITPLIALMKDQVEQLKRKKIPAISIYSGMNKREIDIALDNCAYGNYKFLYVSPERLETEIFKERLKKMKVALIAVDEAHCISQWGYDFRPSYLNISELRLLLPEVPVIALTATATEDVKKDIQEKLLFKEQKVFQKSYARSNLSYSCFYEEDKERKVLEILGNVRGSSIIYVRSRKKALELSGFLAKKKVSSNYYHAGLSNKERGARQESWIKGETRVIVSTNAFGMGIDKPDVRTVIHWELPNSIEAYYQEAGRAGRDEKKAYGVLLFNDNDFDLLKQKINESYPPIDFIKKVYQSLANYYKIAVGSSNMVSYDFERNDFESVYKLPRLETYHALKRLESEGFIQLSEGFYLPSKMMICMDNKSLYEFQIANEKYDGLIKTLLRMYGGTLFSDFVAISEKDITRTDNISVSEVTASLQALQKLDVIIYDQQKDKPQLTFITSRFDASKLPLDVKKIEERKNNDIRKINAIIKYVSQKEKCRTLVLLDYFGEVSDQECGVCDICLVKKKEKKSNDAYHVYRNNIISTLQENFSDLNALVEKIDGKNKEKVIEVIRQMLDTGEIKYEKEKLRLKD